jgi:hypothetical protein
MSDKTKFIAFIDLHKQKADKIKQGTTKAKAIITDHGEFLGQLGAEDENINSRTPETNSLLSNLPYLLKTSHRMKFSE